MDDANMFESTKNGCHAYAVLRPLHIFSGVGCVGGEPGGGSIVANIMEALRWLCGAGEVLAPLCRKFARCFPTHDPGQTLLLPSSDASSLLRECIAALPHAVSVLCCDLSTV
jgi:hypothetical protein